MTTTSTHRNQPDAASSSHGSVPDIGKYRSAVMVKLVWFRQIFVPPIVATIIAIGLVTNWGSAEANEAAATPTDLIRTTTENVLVRLDKAPEINTNPDRLRALVEENIVPHIDFMQLSRLATGKHWRSASDAQKERFTDEFRQLLIRTYSTSLAKYSDQGITYRELNTAKGDKRAVVRATLEQPGGHYITMDYSLYKSEPSWKIYDMKVEGISLVLNYRSTFNREINANGMDGLIRHLALLNR
jgi:phospholipid transport system substrate-binding protein